MYVVLDTVTQDVIGPFETDHDASIFSMEAADLILDADSSQFEIHQLLEPQEWAFQNLDDEDVDKVITKETPKVTPTTYTRKEDNDFDNEASEDSSSVLS